MASRSHCTACLRVLRHRQRSNVLVCLLPSIPCSEAKFTGLQSSQLPLPILQQNAPRLFTTSSTTSAAQVAPAKAPSPAPIREKRLHPASNSDNNNKSPPRVESSPTYNLAKAVRQRASAVTETYVAYGACESLVKECAAQADYSIPQSHEKGVDIPKTKDGEDLGVGKGWWYEGKL